MSGKERSDPFCHHANRGGRKHTGKTRKLEIGKGVVFSSLATCQPGAKTPGPTFSLPILTQLAIRAHLERDKLVVADKEARNSAWAGTGSAGNQHCTQRYKPGVLALVRTRWFSEPLSVHFHRKFMQSFFVLGC